MIAIYTDGSCSINNLTNLEQESDGGFGYCILRNDQVLYEHFEMWHNTTNNRMEMKAIISALEYCQQNYPEEDIIIYSDSAYIVNCIKQQWYKKWFTNGWRNAKREAIKNKDLWKTMLHLNNNWIISGKIQVEKVSGHKGNVWNERADYLANKWRNGTDEDFNIDKESPNRNLEHSAKNL